MTRSALASIVLAGALAAPHDGLSEELAPARIENLEVRSDEDAIRVSFDLRDAFDEEVLDRIRSGLAVTFRHRVELLARRLIPVVPSKVLGRTVIETSARYDSLTRQYYLSRRTTCDPCGPSSEPVIDEASTVATDLTDAQAWMSSLRDVLLPAPPADNERKLRVRVRSVLGRRYRLLIFPTEDSADAEQVLAR